MALSLIDLVTVYSTVEFVQKVCLILSSWLFYSWRRQGFSRFHVTLLKYILCSTSCFDRLLEVIGLLAGSPWPQHSVVANAYRDAAWKKADYNTKAFSFHTCATLMQCVGLLLWIFWPRNDLLRGRAEGTAWMQSYNQHWPDTLQVLLKRQWILSKFT